MTFNDWFWPLLPLKHRLVNDSDQPKAGLLGLQPSRCRSAFWATDQHGK